MKHNILPLLMLFCACGARAECQLVTSQQSVSYGALSAMDRQMAGGKAITLPEKQILLNVMCDNAQRVRLFFGSSLPQGNDFALGAQGKMTFTAMKARVDDKDVLLAPVRTSHGAVTSPGANTADIALNEGIAFVDGEELSGKNISVAIAVNSQVKSQSITDKVKYRGNLQVRLETE